MTNITVHQVLHGYESGHHRLAGSIRLSRKDEALVDRISDLSGPLLGDNNIKPYFTGYPLPSGDFYAFACTWLDRDAARAGSVLTHTLIIPSVEFSNLDDLQFLFQTLQSEPLRKSRTNYNDPMTLSLENRNIDSGNISISDSHAYDFVDKYFWKEIRPILWVDAPEPWHIIRLLFHNLWPQMKQNIAFCSLSLQLRNLDDRPFDWLFCSSSRINKHHQLQSMNIVGYSSKSQSSEGSSNPKYETAQTNFRSVFFSMKANFLQERFWDLWTYLKPEPTIIAKLYRLKELEERIPNSSTAIAGSMDLIASLVPEPNQAISYKETFVSEGISATEVIGDLRERAKTLYLISERLRQIAFASIEDNVFSLLKTTASEIAITHYEYMLELAQSALRSEKLKGSPFLVGLAEGLFKIEDHQWESNQRILPDVLFLLALSSSHISLMSRYYSVNMEASSKVEISQVLAGMLSTLDAPELKLVRNKLLAEVAKFEDVPVLEQLLRYLSTEDTVISLDIIANITSGFSSQPIRKFIEENIAVDYRDSVRTWGLTREIWSYGIASVLAASFEQDSGDELREYANNHPGYPLLLLAYLTHQMTQEMPYWVEDQLLAQPNLVNVLLVKNVIENVETCDVLQEILNKLSGLKLSTNDALLEKVSLYSDKSFGAILSSFVFSNVVREYISGLLHAMKYETWIQSPQGIAWFERVSIAQFKEAYPKATKLDTTVWAKTWNVLESAPTVAYSRKDGFIHDFLNWLIHMKDIDVAQWTEAIARTWSLILLHAQEYGSYGNHLKLCEQALKYSFNHPQLPLSSVVVSSFPVVYNVYMEERETGIFSFWNIFTDWDKGKELRRKLVDICMKSDWPPETLALAMPDKTTFRKIFKRINESSNGRIFIRKMATALKEQEDPHARKMYDVLVEMMSSPDFEEPWI